MTIKPSDIFGNKLTSETRQAIKINRIGDRISESLINERLNESQIKTLILNNVNQANFNDVTIDLKQRHFSPVKQQLLIKALSAITPTEIASKSPQISSSISPQKIALGESIDELPNEILIAINLFLQPQEGLQPDISTFLALLPPESTSPDLRIASMEKARKILNYVKSYDLNLILTPAAKRPHLQESTYPLRTLCLQRSQGLIHSFEAYTYSTNPEKFKNPFSDTSVEYASSSAHYIPERQRDHLKALQNTYIEMIAMSNRFESPKRTLFCLGGNTAAGKSFCAKNDPISQQGLLNGKAIGAINPDNIKAALRKEVHAVTNNQIHVEGAAMCRNLAKELKSKAIKSAMIFDERFAFLPDFKDLINLAENQNGIIHYKDIDGDLLVSSLRVLSRNIHIEPCVPFGPIASGFKALKQNRASLLATARESTCVKTYELHVGDENGKTILACKKKENGSFEILNSTLIEKATRSPTDSEIDAIKNRVIDDALLEKASEIPGVNIAKVQHFKNMTIEQALLEHSLTLP